MPTTINTTGAIGMHTDPLHLFLESVSVTTSGLWFCLSNRIVRYTLIANVLKYTSLVKQMAVGTTYSAIASRPVI